MKLKFFILLNGIILISLLSCKSQHKNLTSKVLIGKWSQYDGTTTENKITKTDFIPSSAIKYDSSEKGTINIGFEIPYK